MATENLVISINQLKEGMTFSAPLLNESGETVLPAHVELARRQIMQFLQNNDFDFYTKGKIINPGKDRKVEAKDAIQKEKERLEQRKASAQEQLSNRGNDPLENNLDSIEKMLQALRLIEESLDAINALFAKFLENPNTWNIFVSKIRQLIGTLMGQLDIKEEEIIRVISNLNFGSQFVSHSLKVCIICLIITRKLRLSEIRIENIGLAGLLHEIGKLTYNLINKLENLNMPPEKLNLDVTYPAYSYKTAKKLLRLPDETCQAILNQHEQLDGQGFPRKISGEQLALGDQIVFTANLVENLFQRMNYKGYNPVVERLQSLLQKYPEKFHPEIINSLTVLKVDDPDYK